MRMGSMPAGIESISEPYLNLCILRKLYYLCLFWWRSSWCSNFPVFSSWELCIFSQLFTYNWMVSICLNIWSLGGILASILKHTCTYSDIMQPQLSFSLCLASYATFAFLFEAPPAKPQYLLHQRRGSSTSKTRWPWQGMNLQPCSSSSGSPTAGCERCTGSRAWGRGSRTTSSSGTQTTASSQAWQNLR